MNNVGGQRMEIPVVRGASISTATPEWTERDKYESGHADGEAETVGGRHDEPWMNVLDAFEPASPPALDQIISSEDGRRFLRGKVIDLGAGTCWSTARLSKVPAVDEVVALDMSERFLTTVGARVIEHNGGEKKKIRFAVASFNEVPFEDESFDCAFLIAALHHSVTPLRTLAEVRRVLKPGGVLFLVESPWPVVRVNRGRAESIRLTRETRATEICYTRGEFEYVLAYAGFDATFTPCDALTTSPVKMAVRKILRRADCEHWVLPMTYTITARKAG